MSMSKKMDLSKGSPCYCTALRKASRRISQMYDDALASSGLKITQRSILAQLDRGGPTSIRALAEALVMDAGGLAHTLKPLERDGLVKIDIDPRDRRGRVVGLTRAGQAKIKETEMPWEAAQQSFERAFGREKAAVLREAMGLLIEDEFAEIFDRTFMKKEGNAHA